jgi:hypothetical protein
LNVTLDSDGLSVESVSSVLYFPFLGAGGEATKVFVGGVHVGAYRMILHGCNFFEFVQ